MTFKMFSQEMLVALGYNRLSTPCYILTLEQGEEICSLSPGNREKSSQGKEGTVSLPMSYCAQKS